MGEQWHRNVFGIIWAKTPAIATAQNSLTDGVAARGTDTGHKIVARVLMAWACHVVVFSFFREQTRSVRNATVAPRPQQSGWRSYSIPALLKCFVLLRDPKEVQSMTRWERQRLFGR